MQTSHAERRRHRRVTVEAPIVLRRPGTPGAADGQLVTNISLAGVYFETDRRDAFSVNDVLIASVSIPEPQRRTFPFTRLAGRGRVVRLDELPAQDESPRRYGVALEFGKDLTALTAVPSRG